MPQRPASRTSCARAAGGQLDRQALEGVFTGLVEPGGLVLGPAAGQPADDRFVHRRLAAGQRCQQALSLFDRAAARPVLGHAGGDREQLGPGGLLAAGGERLQERRVVPGRGGRGRLGQPDVAVDRAAAQARPRRRRPPRQSRADRPGRGRPPSAPGHPGRAGDRPRRSHSRNCASRGKTWMALRLHSGGRMLEGRDRRVDGCGMRRVDRAQAVQGPEGVDRAGVQARSSRPSDRSTSLIKLGHDVRLLPLDQQPLGVQPPELVVVPEGRDQPGGVVLDRAPGEPRPGHPCRPGGRSGRASGRESAFRRRCRGRSGNRAASGCAGRCSCTSR